MDREKVIKALEFCISPKIIYSCYGDCPYAVADDEHKCVEMKRDALALLKEQEEQIKNRDESLEKAREEIKWLRGMLKEQEAVEPIEEFIKSANRHDYHCKRCGNIVGTIFDDKHPIFPGSKLPIKHFCDVCGQAVKWE